MAKNKQKGYVKGYVGATLIIKMSDEKKYTKPKLYVPKINGKASLKKRWYVYYYYKLPNINTFNWNNPIKIKAGINRFKTVTERKNFGKLLINELNEILSNGYCPYVLDGKELAPQITTYANDALKFAFEQKKQNIKHSTLINYQFRLKHFTDWLKTKDLYYIEIKDLTKTHVLSFLNFVAETQSNTSVNNYRRTISALFGVLVEHDYIQQNPFTGIKLKKQTAVKHQTYSNDELKVLKSYLLKNNPYLYKYIVTVAYTFLRPLEVCRLTVGDIDLKRNIITVETKADKLDKVVIIENLKPILQSFELENYPANYNLFSNKGLPCLWQTKRMDSKVNYFSKQFKNVRNALNLDVNNTIYAIRHTYATNIYNNFIANGLNERETILKMLPITRHKSEKSLKNYLRSVNAFMSKDFSDKITLDF